MSLVEKRYKSHLVGIPRGNEPANPYRTTDRASEMGKAREYASKCGTIIEKQFIRIQQRLIKPDDQQRALLESAYAEIWGELSFTQRRTCDSGELAETYTELGEPSTSIFEEGSKEPKNEALKNLFQTLDEVYGINLMELHEEMGRDGDLPAPTSGEMSPYVGYLIQTALILTREALNPTPLILSEKTRWIPDLCARNKEGRSVTQIDAALIGPDLGERLPEPQPDLVDLLKAVRAERGSTWEMVEIRLLLRSRYNTGSDKLKLRKPLRRDLREIQERLGLLALWFCSGRRKIFPFPGVCRLFYVRSPSLRCHVILLDAAFFKGWVDGLETNYQLFSDQIRQFGERKKMSEEELLTAVRLERELTRSEKKLNQALEELEMTEEELVQSDKWKEEGPHQEAFSMSIIKSDLEADLAEILGKGRVARQELSTVVDAEEKRDEITRLIDILHRAQKTAETQERKHSRRRSERLKKLKKKGVEGEEVVLFERPPVVEEEKPKRPRPVKREKPPQITFLEEEEAS